MKRVINKLALASGMVLASWCATTAAFAQAKVFEISSTTFKDGGMLPVKAANSKANSPNPNCVGENVSPQLSWVNAPAATKSFALLMVDPEGRGGAGVNHWVAYGIPASVTGFAEGEVSKLSDKYVGGKSTQGVGFYSGPCTPPNVQPHHYTFVLIATDLEPKDLPPGLTKDELTAKIVPTGSPSRAKGSAGIVGLFVKPAN
jgi:Raf kinase inhibitor-like YbhB/YbcL family protein